MTDVRFYHLKATPLDRALPRLLAKAYEAGWRAVVMAGSPERVEALDAALWTFDQGSFLPHGRARDGAPEKQPIYLTTKEENPAGAKLLVLVDGVEVDPTFLAGFERCLDMFDGNDPEAVEAARARWRRLKDAGGHEITYWRQNERGAWEKAG